MAVNLSPIGGVAGQFFTNNGTPLSGGKIYTYAAGSSTPAATYTSASGGTAHTNPIVLDSGGRVPTGEIWLTDGVQYKFVIKTSADVLIGTYDNIIGINSNFVNYTNQQDIQTATAGQTLFTLPFSYAPGTNSLSVFVDGVNQYGPGAQYAYVETSSTEVTFTNGLHVGAEVKFTTSQLNSSAGGDASQVSYTPPFPDSVATNVEAKLAQTVSVTDFGADPTGVADSGPAIRNALTASDSVYFPAGTYKVTTGNITEISRNNQTLIGENVYNTVIHFSDTSISIGVDISTAFRGLTIKNLTFDGPGKSVGSIAGMVEHAPTAGYNITLENVQFTNWSANGLVVNQWFDTRYLNVWAQHISGIGVYIDGDQSPTIINSGAWYEDCGLALWVCGSRPFIQGLNFAYVDTALRLGREATDPIRPQYASTSASYCAPHITGLNIEPLKMYGTGIHVCTGSNIRYLDGCWIYSDDGVTATTAQYGIYWESMGDAGFINGQISFVSYIGSFNNKLFANGYLPSGSLFVNGFDPTSISNATLLAKTFSAFNTNGYFETPSIFKSVGAINAGSETKAASNVITTTTNYDMRTTTAHDGVFIVLADATSGALTVTLPIASFYPYKELIIKKIDSSANAVTLDTYGTTTVDGVDNPTLAAQWKYKHIISDGTNWLVIANN